MKEELGDMNKNGGCQKIVATAHNGYAFFMAVFLERDGFQTGRNDLEMYHFCIYKP